MILTLLELFLAFHFHARYFDCVPVRVLTMLMTAETADTVSGRSRMETVITITPVNKMVCRLWLKMVRYWSVYRK